MARPRREPEQEYSGATVGVPDEAFAEVREFNMEAEIRRVAREEIASLCGLVLRRTQDRAGMATRVELAAIFGEALADFSQTKAEPGPKEDD
jgi:hypothetical protein